ncbi:type I-E CRISPR-associated protein Cas5/CasD [Corynebacterium poyangense]|uniref:Type I-E CRISPR-associated protein Cas5/CasD n=1 Tax=Corynebacterium poyangense TaxID=2684405 RepID=A0A7H0SQ64_9CORY|nr:type I-E CRISPR-associated protein Cas5/CasD [Corynebacterium poyangense]MBZ8178372.1 type I-E CRISPR-associated protein Cas5/CasD [Corynebacterium poyangense]QNQ90689.1 type I-E CRISPR-associated protein Cas5/CasD [Corynebacterium poyangense]
MTIQSTFIRLAGPVQSWAGPSITGNFVRTEPVPTYTALQGLVAGACGFKRGQWEDWVQQLTFSVRVDRPGTLIDDFHTIAPHEDEMAFKSRLLGAMGKRPADKMLKLTPDGQGSTSISQRTYLSDAEFLIQVTSPNHPDKVATALRNPQFSTYLGRKAFTPSFPFYLGNSSMDILTLLPVYRPNQELGSTQRARIYHRSRGADTGPEIINVPAVATRREWLDAAKNQCRLRQ